MRVLAVANPKVSHAEFEAGNTQWGKFLADRALKSEGYGLIRVDHASRKFHLECWEWNTDPRSGSQFKGWPVICPFEASS
jgi:alkaline phosphatase D